MDQGCLNSNVPNPDDSSRKMNPVTRRENFPKITNLRVELLFYEKADL